MRCKEDIIRSYNSCERFYNFYKDLNDKEMCEYYLEKLDSLEIELAASRRS